MFVSGTRKKRNACVKPPKISWIEKTHGKLRCATTNPPITGPTVVPSMENKTMNEKGTAGRRRRRGQLPCPGSLDHQSQLFRYYSR